MVVPPPRVLDLFAVPDDVAPLPGGRGDSYLAGDLVLSPGRDRDVAVWLSPLLARLAVTIDEQPRRRPRDLRIAVPVPARDGSWVVDGWGASRYEPGTVACHDLDVLVETGRVLHAQLAVAIPRRPAGLAVRRDRWSVAEQLAFGPSEDIVAEAVRRQDPGLGVLIDDLVTDLGRNARVSEQLGHEQLVHGDLAGNVLLDRVGAPVVIDLSPYWRPALWAEAVCVLDAALWMDAGRDRIARWRDDSRHRQALARAAVFRLFSDRPVDVPRYRHVLA